MTTLRAWRHRRGQQVLPAFFAAAAVSTLAVFLAALFCLETGARLGGVPVWPVNGLLIGACLSQPRLSRSLVLGFGCLADYAARVLAHQPVFAAGVMSLGDALEVIAVVEILAALTPGELDLSRPRHFWSLVLTACAAPMLAGLAEGLILSRALGPGSVRFALGVLARDGLGILILPPPLLRITDPSLRELERRLRSGRGWASILTLATVLVLVFGQAQYRLFFLLPSALIFVAFDLGQAGAAYAVLVVAAATLALTAAGQGPLAVDAFPVQRLTVLQIFLATVSLAITPVGAALSRRNRLEEELRTALVMAQASERASGEALRKSRLAQQIAGVGEWRYDARTDTFVWSEQTYRIFGVARGFPGERLTDALAAYLEPDRARIRAFVAEALATGNPFETEARLRRAGDGSERVVVVRGEAELGPEGRPHAVLGVIRDVTEEELARQRLEESELRYRAIADNATDLITRCDLAGRLTYVSPSVERITGYPAERLIGRSLLRIAHPADVEEVAAALRQVRRGGAGRTLSYRIRHKDGRLVWLESNAIQILDAQGRPAEVVEVCRDVSARVALEAGLREARDAAEAAARVKSDFMANMSHEIRTPLTAILGYTRLLTDRAGLDAAAAAFVRRIAGAGEALLSIVNDVLDFSKLEAGQVRIEPGPTDVGLALRDALQMFEPQADAKGVALRFRGDPELPPWLGVDAHRLRQIVLNLVGNAVKFTERGHVALAVRYDADRRRLSVAIEDTGPGIGPEQRAALFQRFSQVDASTSRRHGGTGLGLAICKGLAEAMGGGIGVESEPGLGSTFVFWIAAEPCAPPTARAAEPLPALPKARILVVDDNRVNRELVRALLEPLGSEVVEAADGLEAVEAADRMALDAILMDLRMPGLDGRAAAGRIRAGSGPNATAPILAFSADADLEGAPGDAALFDGRVRKPLTPGELLAALVDALDAGPRAAPAAELALAV